MTEPSGTGEAFPEDVPVPLAAYPRVDDEVPGFLARAGVPGIVDVHVHCMPERLQQAVWRYFDALDEPRWPIRYRQDLATRLGLLADVGVVAHTALAYAHRPGMLRWCNDFTLGLAEDEPQVVPTFTIYPDDDVVAEVERALDRGGAVVKVHTQLSGYLLDDPRLDRVWPLLAEARTLVVAHTSAVYGVDGGEATSGGAQVHRLKRAHPDLRLSIAHLGLPDPDGSQWAAVEGLDGVWSDVSAALVEPFPEIGPTGGFDVDAVRERLRDHLLFGSDFPSIPFAYADQVRGLAHLRLDPAGLRAVLHDRTAALLADAGWQVPGTPAGGAAGPAEPPSHRPADAAPVRGSTAAAALPADRLLGMTREEFRAAGHALVDWVADFTDRLEDLPVQPDVAPGDLRALLPPAPPTDPEPFDAVLADLERIVVPGLTNWQSPNWFAYFPTGASYPSVLADLLTAALGQQGMLWSSSPITTELEQHVLDWLVGLLGLPAHFRSDGPGGGVLQMSASDSTHTALVVARERATREHGVPARDQVAYASTQAHSSIEKGATVAGYGHLRQVAVDDAFALRPDALAAAVAADRAAGLHPTFVCAAVGTTGTTAIDPVRAVAELARAEGLWCHVDAAYAGAAMLLPECRWMQDGVELVDSYTWNPHKWFAVGFDCSVFHVADRAPLLDVLSILPAYLRDQAGDGAHAVDLRDWHVPLGRRPRALKLWFVLRAYGVAGLQALLREHLRLARWFHAQVEAHPDLEVVAPTVLGLVTLRHLAGDDATRALGSALVADRAVALTPSTLERDGASTACLRVSIGATLTRAVHVEALWERVARLAPEVADT